MNNKEQTFFFFLYLLLKTHSWPKTHQGWHNITEYSCVFHSCISRSFSLGYIYIQLRIKTNWQEVLLIMKYEI